MEYAAHVACYQTKGFSFSLSSFFCLATKLDQLLEISSRRGLLHGQRTNFNYDYSIFFRFGGNDLHRTRLLAVRSHRLVENSLVAKRNSNP